MQRDKCARVLAVIGGGAVFWSAIVAFDAPAGQPLSGSGMEPDITFVQPTSPAMTIGLTTIAAKPASTLATSAPSPTVKATPLGSECNTTGQCP